MEAVEVYVAKFDGRDDYDGHTFKLPSVEFARSLVRGLLAAEDLPFVFMGCGWVCIRDTGGQVHWHKDLGFRF